MNKPKKYEWTIWGVVGGAWVIPLIAIGLYHIIGEKAIEACFLYAIVILIWAVRLIERDNRTKKEEIEKKYRDEIDYLKELHEQEINRIIDLSEYYRSEKHSKYAKEQYELYVKKYKKQ